MQLHLAREPRLATARGPAHALAPLDAALLAWLALEGPTPRARLAQLLWPDKDVEAARNSLRQRLFQLRKTVGTDLVQGSTTLALAEGVAHDLDDADGVLGETAGEDLAPGEFAQWLALQRSRRQARVRTALVELADMAEAARDWDDALAHARELIALEPLSEDAHRRVIRLHYLAGDRAAALLAFDACERVLKDEVGARPSAEMLDLLRTIELAARAQAATEGVAQGRMPAAVLRPPRLVGRDAQWQALADTWRTQACALVVGEAGMGKTRLLADFAQRRPGIVTSGARPGDARVVHATLSRLLRALPSAALATLPEALRAELARLLPELGPSAAADGDAARTRLLNAVAALLRSPPPGLEAIVLDDLHFADDASLEALQYAAAGAPLRWLLAARGAEITPAGQALIEGLQAEAALVRVELPPLAVEEVARLLASLELPGIDADALAPALWRRTGGNPMYLLESLKAWLARSEGTDGAAPAAWPLVPNVATLIERRIGQLSQRAVQLARCAAVAAPDFSIELAEHVLGLRALELADPWAELESAQVLRGDGAFAHDLIYDSALRSVPRPIALQLHAEIARWLSARGAAAASVANHAWQGGLWAMAGPAWAAVAHAARRTGRFAEAADAFGRAAESLDRCGERAAAFELRREQLSARVSHGIDEQTRQLAEALPAAAADEAQRLDALRAQLEYLLYRGDFPAMREPGDQALALARRLHSVEREVDVAVLLAAGACQQNQPARALALLEPLEAWVRAQGPAAQRAGFLEVLAFGLAGAGRLEEARLRYQEPLQLALQAGERAHQAELVGHLAWVHARIGQVSTAVTLVREAIALVAGAADSPASTHVAQKQATLAGYLHDLGRYDEAIVLQESLIERFRGEGLAVWTQSCELGLAQAHIELGQLARAQRLLQGLEGELSPTVRLRRDALRADLAASLGAGAESAAAALVADPEAEADLNWRPVTAMMAVRVLPPLQALARLRATIDEAVFAERRGLLAELHARAAEAARLAGDRAGAVLHAQAALGLSCEHYGTRLYRAEIPWQAHLALEWAGERDAGASALGRAIDQLRIGLTQVPAPFRPSFLERNPVNRALLVEGRARGLLLAL